MGAGVEASCESPVRCSWTRAAAAFLQLVHGFGIFKRIVVLVGALVADLVDRPVDICSNRLT
jgi:hypothetical protein